MKNVRCIQTRFVSLIGCSIIYLFLFYISISCFYFSYSPIDIWEISLPPPFIEIKYDTNELQNQLIDEVRIMAQKGHEIFSFVHDKLTCLGSDESDINGTLKHLLAKEQTQFKQKVEEIQLKLTSPSIENKDFEEKGNFSL